MYVLALPDDVMEKILSYVSYDEVSHCRLVCHRFNEISKRVLNHGFHKVENYHSQCLKYVKSQLPRRESERRNHPLARHCDILTAIETRLSLLSMTFKKFIDLNYCCFIPGKVLDEIYRVLRYVTSIQSPIRTHEVLQELRDLSSMAMEYFDEKIAPGLKRRKETGPKINIRSNKNPNGDLATTSPKHLRPNAPLPQIYKMARYINELAKRHNKLSSRVTSLQIKKKELDSVVKKVAILDQFTAETRKKLTESEKVINEQQSTIKQQAGQILEQKLKIEKLSKLVEGKQLVCSCSYGSSSKNLRTNNKKKQNLTSTKIKKSPVSQRSLKRKLIQNLDSRKKIKVNAT